MKISELNTKSFLGATGAAANSYVLINYEDNTTSAPVTYKASIDELGKAIANNLQLYKKTQNGAVTTSVNNGAYADGTAEQFITSAALTDFASIGYVTNAVANAGGTTFDPMVYEADDCSHLVFANSENELGFYSGDEFVPLSSSESTATFDPRAYLDLTQNVKILGYNTDTDNLAIGNYDEQSDSYSWTSPIRSYAWIEDSVSPVLHWENISGNVINFEDVAFMGESDSKPCIRDYNDNFIGFLSTT